MVQKKKQKKKKTINIYDVNAGNIVISKLVETKGNSKYLIWYLDEVARPLILRLPKMSGYIKTFKVREWDIAKNNKLNNVPKRTIFLNIYLKSIN